MSNFTLLPGWALAASNLLPLQQALQERLPALNIQAAELPPGLQMSTLEPDLTALAEALPAGWLGGWSLGGVLAVQLRASGVQKAGDLVDASFRGAGAMLPIATLLVLAFGIGAICDELGTGPFIAAQVTPYLTPLLVAPLVCLVSGAIATGTSWGTFAIMIPLALPLAATMNLEGAAVSLPLVVSAVLGGGVFGAHCSPISDTTLISSMAAWSDHIDHEPRVHDMEWRRLGNWRARCSWLYRAT